MPTSVLTLSHHIDLLPVLHGSGDFALEVRRRILVGDYDCVAVPIPPAFEDPLEDAVGRLPAVHLVVQPEGNPGQDPESATYVPVDPCQPVISALRTAVERDIPRAYIDLEVDRYVEQASVLPDPYALKEVSLERFTAALVPALPTPQPQQMDQIHWMAFQLHLLEMDYERILFVCTVADWPWIRDAYRQRLDYPEPSPPARAPEALFASTETLFFAMGELPAITALYEHRRAELLPSRTLAVDGIKALLLDARARWIDKHDLKQHWLTPQTLSTLLRYVRNLTLSDSRMSPDLYNLALAAKQVAGDDFAVTLIETAREYPPQTLGSPHPEVTVGVDRAALPWGELEIKNRLKGADTEWRTLPLKPIPPPEKRHTWRMTWDPFRQCSYPPEDERIESFNTHVREQAKAIIGQDLAKTEKFTTSLRDGLDIRETLRNWHTGDIYVKEIPPSRGNIEVVVMLFDSPADPAKYPWHTTWYAEHKEESTLCFYATEFADNIIGPGIAQAVYGGCSLMFPPRPIPDIWSDQRFAEARTLEERLLSAALFHSRERRVVLVAPTPPSVRWRRIAKKYRKQIVYIPLKRFSMQTIDRLRRFHVLNGYEVRSYAAKYIRDFR